MKLARPIDDGPPHGSRPWGRENVLKNAGGGGGGEDGEGRKSRGSWEEDGLLIPKFWTAKSSQSLQSTLQKSSTFYEINSILHIIAQGTIGHVREGGWRPPVMAGKRQCRVV